MERKMRLILLIIITVLFSNCTGKYSTKVVVVDRIDTSGIYFTYEDNSKNFNGHFDLGDIHEDFTTSDSLKIEIDKNQPEKFEFISVVERVWEAEKAIVSLNGNNSQIIYSYHSVDQKPLFLGAESEYENDSLIFDFFQKYSNPTNDFKKIGVYILINEKGVVKFKKAVTKNKDELELIKKLINKLPNFSPAINEANNVSVSYLIEIPVYK